MNWEWTLAGAGIGIIAFAIRRYIDWRINSITIGRLELIKESSSDLYHAISDIYGDLSQIDHYLRHISAGDQAYVEKAREWCRAVREKSRQQKLLLGQQYVDLVSKATDIAFQYLDTKNEESLLSWGCTYSELSALGYTLPNRLIQSLEKKPPKIRGLIKKKLR